MRKRDGSGSVHLTNGSGSGRPKNVRILRIRIRIPNTGLSQELQRILSKICENLFLTKFLNSWPWCCPSSCAPWRCGEPSCSPACWRCPARNHPPRNRRKIPNSHANWLVVSSSCSVADPGCLSRTPDPDFYPSRIPDLGSRIQKQPQKRGVKKNLLSYLFFVTTNFTKLQIISFY